MKIHAVASAFLFSCVLMGFYSCKSDGSANNPIIDPEFVKTSSLAVIDVSGKNNLPNQYKIDGLLSSNSSHSIGNSKLATGYIPVEAGVRKLSIGNYTDTVRIQESNYYTVMIYDNDSIRLSLDAPYGKSQFQTIPQVRWLISGDDAANLKVNFHSDSLLRDIKVDKFTPVTYAKKEIKLSVYGSDNIEKANVDVPVSLSRKETVMITKNATNNSYSFSIISQKSNP